MPQGIYKVLIDGTTVLSEMRIRKQMVRLANRGDFAMRRKLDDTIQKRLDKETRDSRKFAGKTPTIEYVRDAQQPRRARKRAKNAVPEYQDKVLAVHELQRARRATHGHR